MSSNYNYNNFSLAQLNSLTPVTTPEMSEEDLARELEFWSNTQFTFEVPPGIGLLDEEFQVSPTIDTKFEEQNVNVVTQPAMIVQHDLTTLADQTQSRQTLHYPLFAFPTSNSLVPTRMQSITMTPVSASSNTDNFTHMFPTIPVPANINNSVTLSEESKENASNMTPSTTNVTTDSTSTTVKTIDTTNTATNNTTSSTSTSGPISSPNRKNSSAKSNHSSNSETTQNGSAETKEGENDPELSAKLAAEEDKRRRNTAASARFRVKKKMREQALERTAREMTAKAEMFESRVKELEMEIKWLRSLVVEKDSRLLDERPGKKRKKVESRDEDDEDEDDDEKEEEVKQEQSDRTKQKGIK